jgi:hypothetical protein
MREQRKSNYNRKLAGKLYNWSLDQIEFKMLEENDVQKWMSPQRELSI